PPNSIEPPAADTQADAGVPVPPDGRIGSPPTADGRSAQQRRTVPAGRARSMDDLRAELATAIEAGQLDTYPSAEAIRRTLACAPAKARALRDEHTRPAGTDTAPLSPVQ